MFPSAAIQSKGIYSLSKWFQLCKDTASQDKQLCYYTMLKRVVAPFEETVIDSRDISNNMAIYMEVWSFHWPKIRFSCFYVEASNVELEH